MFSWETADAACKTAVCATSPMDLGTLGTNLPGSVNSEAFAVSDNGSVVVGNSLVALDPSQYALHAFLWQNGVMVDLGALGGNWSTANDISGSGEVVVGAATTADGATTAFRWTKSTGMVDIGSLGNGATAWAVNKDGSVIVGQSVTVSRENHAFRWTSSDGMSDLGTLGGDYAVAYDVNDKGDVVVGGSSISGPTGSHAFRWTTSAGMTDLGSFGGNSQANAVNGSGSTVVGWAADEHGVTSAFRWTADTGMLSLGILPGGSGSIANDVSDDSSVVVGDSTSSGTSWRAFR